METIKQREIDTLLRRQNFDGESARADLVYHYAESLSVIENCTVVVSDLKAGTSRIFHGKFSDILGIRRKETENSIWETDIINRLPEEEKEKKFLAELRFFNFIRRTSRGKRENYHLASHLKMKDTYGKVHDVLHRMYYVYESKADAIRFGICIYELPVFDMPAESVVIDSESGKWMELSAKSDCEFLSAREKQVLSLIEKGLTSKEIAAQLYISKNTVSRHRQEILAKLQVKNSTEACLRARRLKII